MLKKIFSKRYKCIQKELAQNSESHPQISKKEIDLMAERLLLREVNRSTEKTAEIFVLCLPLYIFTFSFWWSGSNIIQELDSDYNNVFNQFFLFIVIGMTIFDAFVLSLKLAVDEGSIVRLMFSGE